MKNIIYYISAVCLFVLYACDGKIDPIEEFTNGEEIRYAGKALEPRYLAGKNRLELQFTLSPDPNVNKAIIYWDLKHKSMEIAINRESMTDKVVRQLIEDLPENVYNFEIYTFDRFGNSSVAEHLNARTYGNKYQNSLYARNMKDYSIANLDGDIQINWGDSILYSAEMELTYTNKENKQVKLTVANTESYTILKDLDANKPLNTRTFFLPEPDAIDIFYVDGEELNLEIDPNMQLELAKPYTQYYVNGFDPDLGSLGALWNGRWGRTFSWSNGGDPWADEAGWAAKDLPKGAWITFDMGQPIRISHYRTNFYWPYWWIAPKITELWAYTGTGEPTAAEAWDNWQKLGEIDNSTFVITEADMIREYPLGDNIYVDRDKAVTSRYYRVKYIEGRVTENTDISISEVTFWTYLNN